MEEKRLSLVSCLVMQKNLERFQSELLKDVEISCRKILEKGGIRNEKLVTEMDHGGRDRRRSAPAYRPDRPGSSSDGGGFACPGLERSDLRALHSLWQYPVGQGPESSFRGPHRSRKSLDRRCHRDDKQCPRILHLFQSPAGGLQGPSRGRKVFRPEEGGDPEERDDRGNGLCRQFSLRGIIGSYWIGL